MHFVNKVSTRMRRVWTDLTTRLGVRKSGVLKLQNEIRSCKYRDVHVMWEMLRRSESETDESPKRCKMQAFTKCFGWTSFLNVIPGMDFLQRVDGRSLTGTSRKMRGSGYNPSNEKNDVDVEDYDSVDPVPSSKASVKPGPIEHGSPLIPYIPKPSPPDHPKIGGST